MKLSIVTRPYRDESGTVPLYLRITHKQKTQYVSLNIRIKERHWNKKEQRARKAYKNADKLNAFLSHTLTQAEGVVLDVRASGVALATDRVTKAIKHRLFPSEEDVDDFLAYADGVLPISTLQQMSKKGMHSATLCIPLNANRA